MKTDLREILASLEHEQWMTWAKNLELNEPRLSKRRIKQWKKYMVPYEELKENIKDEDRVWADKVLHILKVYEINTKSICGEDEK